MHGPCSYRSASTRMFTLAMNMHMYSVQWLLMTERRSRTASFRLVEILLHLSLCVFHASSHLRKKICKHKLRYKKKKTVFLFLVLLHLSVHTSIFLYMLMLMLLSQVWTRLKYMNTSLSWTIFTSQFQLFCISLETRNYTPLAHRAGKR